MKLTVRLKFLDEMTALAFDKPMQVLFNTNPDEVIGSCEIYSDAHSHFADLQLNDDTSMDLYLSWSGAMSDDKTYDLENISLDSNPPNDKPTKTLKEITIKCF